MDGGVANGREEEEGQEGFLKRREKEAAKAGRKGQ
jgi:hypothetical protein